MQVNNTRKEPPDLPEPIRRIWEKYRECTYHPDGDYYLEPDDEPDKTQAAMYRANKRMRTKLSNRSSSMCVNLEMTNE